MDYQMNAPGFRETGIGIKIVIKPDIKYYLFLHMDAAAAAIRRMDWKIGSGAEIPGRQIACPTGWLKVWNSIVFRYEPIGRRRPIS